MGLRGTADIKLLETQIRDHINLRPQISELIAPAMTIFFGGLALTGAVVLTMKSCDLSPLYLKIAAGAGTLITTIVVTSVVSSLRKPNIYYAHHHYHTHKAYYDCIHKQWVYVPQEYKTLPSPPQFDKQMTFYNDSVKQWIAVPEAAIPLSAPLSPATRAAPVDFHVGNIQSNEDQRPFCPSQQRNPAAPAHRDVQDTQMPTTWEMLQNRLSGRLGHYPEEREHNATLQLTARYRDETIRKLRTLKNDDSLLWRYLHTFSDAQICHALCCPLPTDAPLPIFEAWKKFEEALSREEQVYLDGDPWSDERIAGRYRPRTLEVLRERFASALVNVNSQIWEVIHLYSDESIRKILEVPITTEEEAPPQCAARDALCFQLERAQQSYPDSNPAEISFTDRYRPETIETLSTMHFGNNKELWKTICCYSDRTICSIIGLPIDLATKQPLDEIVLAHLGPALTVKALSIFANETTVQIWTRIQHLTPTELEASFTPEAQLLFRFGPALKTRAEAELRLQPQDVWAKVQAMSASELVTLLSPTGRMKDKFGEEAVEVALTLVDPELSESQMWQKYKEYTREAFTHEVNLCATRALKKRFGKTFLAVASDKRPERSPIEEWRMLHV
ncbi:MAG: hypothetical protein ACKVOH_05520 [Chlamydiales bacterium]